MKTPEEIKNAAASAVLSLGLKKLPTAQQFKTLINAARSLLVVAPDAPPIDGLAAAVRAEVQAVLGATARALAAGCEMVNPGEVRIKLTAAGSSATHSTRYRRDGTEAETADACRTILALIEPPSTASAGARAQFHARQRLATARLIALDPVFALAHAEKTAIRAREYADKLRAAAPAA